MAEEEQMKRETGERWGGRRRSRSKSRMIGARRGEEKRKTESNFWDPREGDRVSAAENKEVKKWAELMYVRLVIHTTVEARCSQVCRKHIYHIFYDPEGLGCY